jgi:uroporphyrinogen decarboxylase
MTQQTNNTFLDACWSKPTSHIPVWFMRQAGRSLPGYRKLRETYDVLTIAHTPELAAQVSLEPVERLGVDAAILFADIMLLPIALGVDVKIVDSIGPIVEHPIQTESDLSLLQPFSAEKITYLKETIHILRSSLAVPLIGFSGAPFTLASYLIEGQPSRTWTKTKQMIQSQPKLWHSLMEILSEGIIGYLSVQIDAGAQAVQLFDSWVGCLSPDDYRVHVLPYTQKIFNALKNKSVPRIHFGTNTSGMLTDFTNVDCEVIGVDWRIDLDVAKKIIGDKAIQGNLDPAVLLAPQKIIEEKVDTLLESLSTHTGYIFNLGHGILPESDDVKVKQLVEYIHGKTPKR